MSADCMRPRIREAHTADIPVLLEIVQSAYRGEGGWTTEAHLVRGHRTDEGEMRAMLEDPEVLLLVAEVPAERPDHAPAAESTRAPMTMLGCCCTRRDPTDPLCVELGLFAVSPSAQGSGVGRALLDAHVEHQVGAGVRRIALQVLQSRPELQAWYERRGFQAVEGSTSPFPADPSLLMDPGLRMQWMVRTLP